MIRGSQGGDQDLHFGPSDSEMWSHSTCAMEAGSVVTCVQVVVSASEVVCPQKRK